MGGEILLNTTATRGGYKDATGSASRGTPSREAAALRQGETQAVSASRRGNWMTVLGSARAHYAGPTCSSSDFYPLSVFGRRHGQEDRLDMGGHIVNLGQATGSSSEFEASTCSPAPPGDSETTRASHRRERQTGPRFTAEDDYTPGQPVRGALRTTGSVSPVREEEPLRPSCADEEYKPAHGSASSGGSDSVLLAGHVRRPEASTR